MGIMTHLDLFSGIGGFALAARWAGIETVGFCEIEEFPRKVLQKNFPGVRIHHDIRELNGSEYEGIDLITGGYPCQPFSVAGKQKGAEDDRHLWPEMFRIITQARPTWVVAENVAGHISMGLDQVLLDLENEGYATRAVAIPACGVDAHHRRNRVWIVGYAESRGNWDVSKDQREGSREVNSPYNSSGLSRRNDQHGNGATMGYSEHNGSFATEKQGGVIKAGNNHTEGQNKTSQFKGASMPGNSSPLADTDGEQCGGLLQQKLQRDTSSSGNRRGKTGTWSVEPSVGRVADGVPGRVDRLKGLGNAIVPQVAYEILRCIKAQERIPVKPDLSFLD